MNPDLLKAAELGFLRPQYLVIERERRWLCGGVPRDRIRETSAITDTYIPGTRMRLRREEMKDGATRLRLSRKADVDRRTRLISSIYMPEDEFEILRKSLRGTEIHKLRHRLNHPLNIDICVDEFQGSLTGLILAEAQFETSEALNGFLSPDFALREVTDDLRFTGGALARDGLPLDL